jgi:hypothetical protein
VSRQYRWHGETLTRRSGLGVQPYTRVWAAARQRRSERRAAAPRTEQSRDDLGFIIKVTPLGSYLYDPGLIDRYLWCRAHDTTE